MPYEVRKSGEYWEVYNPETGRVYGKHKSKEEAEAHKRALYANADPKKEHSTFKIRRS